MRGGMLLAVVMTAVPAIGMAQTYRWRDDHGQVQYTQVPPKDGREYTVIGPAPPPSSAPNQQAINKALADANAAEPKRREAAAAAAAAEEQRRKECQNAREQLAYMDSTTAHRTLTRDAQGNVARVTDDEFRARRAEIQKAADEKCS